MYTGVCDLNVIYAVPFHIAEQKHNINILDMTDYMVYNVSSNSLVKYKILNCLVSNI